MHQPILRKKYIVVQTFEKQATLRKSSRRKKKVHMETPKQKLVAGKILKKEKQGIQDFQ